MLQGSGEEWGKDGIKIKGSFNLPTVSRRYETVTHKAEKYLKRVA